MLKIFLTGDNHIGKKYDRYPEVKSVLIESRFESLRRMVGYAEKEGCEFFVVAGDLFDNIHSIKTSDVTRVVEILAEFDGSVLILPGNHDYYTGEEKVWADFQKAMEEREHNITLLNEFRAYSFDAKDMPVTVYPAFCQSKHSRENNLGWIKEEKIVSEGAVHIGIAHGALSGVTPDIKEEYFLMREEELLAIPMDVWLLGHTHIPYPKLCEEKDTQGFRIFNAGTHEQTDFHNHTAGFSFVLSIEKSASKSTVYAHAVQSGRIRYYDLEATIAPDKKGALRARLEEITKALEDSSVVRVRLRGRAGEKEYAKRAAIYQEILGRFLTFACEDAELSEEITAERIKNEFSELSFAAGFLEALAEDPTELQMAYELLTDCREPDANGSSQR